MTCEEISRQLEAHVAGLAVDAVAIESHLDACAECRARRVALLPYAPPPDARARMAATLARAVAQPPVAAPDLRRALVAAAASVLLLIVAALGPDPGAGSRVSIGGRGLAESVVLDPRGTAERPATSGPAVGPG